MAVPTQVLSMRIPVGSELQARVSTAARKAGILPWQLLVQMLDAWEQQHDEPPAETWQEVVSGLKAEINSLRDELNVTKKQILHDIDIVDKVDTANKADVPGEFQDIVDIVDDMIDFGESQVNVDIVDNANIEAFDAAYTNLERDRHAKIWQLRDVLGWEFEQVDAMIRQLRDSGKYNPTPGGELGEMTPEQLRSAFVDENGNAYHLIMRVPAPTAAPMGEPEPEPEAPAAPAPEPKAPKPQNQKRQGKKTKAIGAAAATTEETKKQKQTRKEKDTERQRNSSGDTAKAGTPAESRAE